MERKRDIPTDRITDKEKQAIKKKDIEQGNSIFASLSRSSPSPNRDKQSCEKEVQTNIMNEQNRLY